VALFRLTSIVCITVTHENPSQQPEKQRYKWWQLPQLVQIDGRKHNYPILQQMKAWQELYCPQEQSKGRSQPNFCHSTETILLEETEVRGEKQHQNGLCSPTCWRSSPSFILSRLKSKQKCRDQTPYFRSAVVITGVLGEQASASLFSKLMKPLGVHHRWDLGINFSMPRKDHATIYHESVTPRWPTNVAHTDALSLFFTYHLCFQCPSKRWLAHTEGFPQSGTVTWSFCSVSTEWIMVSAQQLQLETYCPCFHGWYE